MNDTTLKGEAHARLPGSRLAHDQVISIMSTPV